MSADRDPNTGHFNAWIPPNDVTDIFFKFRCNITDCSKALNIHRDTFYSQLKKNPEFKAKFEEVEASLDREWLDQSEKSVWYALSLAKDRPGHSLKAAMYVLDKRGHKRGWGTEQAANNDQEKLLGEWASFIAQKRGESQSSDLNISEMSNNAESRS